MNKPARMTIVCIALCTALAAQTPTEAGAAAESLTDSAPADQPPVVLVVGEQPGPGLWKVSRDEHVMWVLGTYGPLPKAMHWRAKDVEARIAESQEVLYSGRVNVGTNIGILRGLTLLPSLIKAGQNPHDARLKDVLPEQTYAKWLTLKAKYIGDDSAVEKLRPTFAADELNGAAMRKSGLAYASNVESVVNKLARAHKVRINTLPTITRKTDIENPRGILKAARRTEFSDVDCFSQSLDALEPDIEALKRYANAWAIGDLATLRANVGANKTNYCMVALINALRSGAIADGTAAQQAFADLGKQAEQGHEELEQNWLAAAESALRANRSTFAVLPIQALVSRTGYLAALRAKGYLVEEPQ